MRIVAEQIRKREMVRDGSCVLFAGAGLDQQVITETS